MTLLDHEVFLPLNIAVLTVTDTRSVADDKSGALLCERIKTAGHMLVGRDVVPDEIDMIHARVKEWIDDETVDVIITTGGTGLTGRDVTPEAITPLLTKTIDGFGDTSGKTKSWRTSKTSGNDFCNG